MKKYNKNLYKYATEYSGGKDIFKSMTLVFKNASYLYMLIMVFSVLFGAVIRLTGKFKDFTFQEISEYRSVIVVYSTILVLGIAGFCFSVMKKNLIEFPLILSAALINVIVSLPVLSDSFKGFFFFYLLPSSLSALFAIYCFIRVIVRNIKISKKYEELSLKLYKRAVAENPDGRVTNLDHEKAMAEYKGGPIKIKQNDK